MTLPDLTRMLIDTASAPYRAAGRSAYYFARGKLRGDPVFVRILELGLLRGRRQILDLGCGQGLLAAWLFATREPNVSRAWPASWPAAPDPESIRGIDLRQSDVWRAQRTMGAKAQFLVGDIRTVEFDSADAVVVLDVLHYIDYGEQERVLRRVRTALGTGGVLYLRVGDAAGGIRFRVSKFVDQVLLLALERRRPRLYCRSVRDWQQVLADNGFHSESMQMSAGTLFANVLLTCRPT